jgi:hypothetical protein
VAANEIQNHFVKTFESNVIHLAQQKYSKFRRTVTEKMPGATEKHAFRVVGARGAMTARTNVGADAGKRTATPFANTPFNDRVAVPTHYGTADSYSRAEVSRMITDPQSAMTTAFAAQVGRTFDDVIVAALFANALDSAGNSNAHPAANQLGGAAIAPSFDLFRDLREVVLENEVDPDEEVFLAVSPNVVAELLTDDKATSVDYTNGKALMAGGIVQGWMGFTWLVSNRLTVASAGPPDQIYCGAWTRDAMGLLVTQDVTVKVGEDPGTWFDTVVHAECDLGSVRIQDAKVWRIHILETN